MEENKNLYVGFDLCNEYSQISCFHPKTGEVETIGLRGEESYHLIPTVLGVTEIKKEWLFGEYAQMMAEHKDGVLVDNIVEKIIMEQPFEIYGVSFEPTVILAKFFKKSLVLLKRYYPNETILKLVVTVEQMNGTLMKYIYKALEQIGLMKDRVTVLPHTQCYLYYALSQKRELWLQDVGMFDYGKSGLAFYRININRKNHPMVVGVSKKDLSDQMPYEMLHSGRFEEKKLANLFFDIAEGILYKQNISTVYITGEGFYDTWADHKMPELCAGRRVFKGPNIYTRGACYGARILHTGEFDETFLFMGEDCIESAISVPLYKDGVVQKFQLAKAGSLWHEVNETVTFIFDGEEEIPVEVKKLTEKEGTTRLINLEGIPRRPNKMGRYELKLTFLDTKTCLFTIRDKGFGEYALSSRRVWEKVIEL